MASRPSPDDLQASDAGIPDAGWLRPGRHLLAGLAVLLLGFYFSANTALTERQRDFFERQAEVQLELADFRTKLETEVYASEALVRGLGVQVILQEGISEQEFRSISAELLNRHPQILNLSVAPGFVISSVQPAEGNQKAIGLALLEDPVQKAAMLRAIANDAPVLAGPFELVQGGRALAVRVPLWVQKDGVGRLWGAVSVVLDYTYVMRHAGIRRLEKELDIDIVGQDASGPGGGLIQGPRISAGDKPVKMPVFLPGGSWLISAVPKEGWYRESVWASPGFLFRLLLSVLAALATARILYDRRRIRRLAGVDVLTNLPNRRWAMQQLGRLITRGQRGGGFALLYFDLNGFKPVNDTYGHAAGDQLLAEIGRRLNESVRPGDLVARMGGDEFLVLVPIEDGADEDWLRAMARRVQSAVSSPVVIDGFPVTVGASVGIARFPEDGEDSGTLLRRSDEAMYRAKQARADGIEFVGASPVRGAAPAA